MITLSSSASVGSFITKKLLNNNLSEDNVLKASQAIDIEPFTLSTLAKDEMELTPSLALKLELATGISAESWIAKSSSCKLEALRKGAGVTKEQSVATTHFFIDSENILPSDINAIKQLDDVKVWFLGNINDKMSNPTVATFIESGIQGQSVILKNRAKNALDFHITFLLGQVAATQPKAKFFVLSKDTGYDQLLEYIRESGFQASRIENFNQALPTANKPVTHKNQGIMLDMATHSALLYIELQLKQNAKAKTPKALKAQLANLQDVGEFMATVYNRLTQYQVISLDEAKCLIYSSRKLKDTLALIERRIGEFALTDGVDSLHVTEKSRGSVNSTGYKPSIIKSRLDMLTPKQKLALEKNQCQAN